MTGDAALPTGRVSLVGAGPGSPGLLTVRAAELLAEADLVLYDQLVPRRLLDTVNPAAECVGVRDLPGQPADRSPPLLAKMLDAARAGKNVVRLKSGDPLTFGRGTEELESLRAAGVTYEVVPGVTAALACAAYLELPVAHRSPGAATGAVALVTGHDLPAKPGQGLDWAGLAQFPGTLAIYMGVARLPLIAAELIRHGRDPDTPAGVVERASTGDMRSVFAPLATLDYERRQAGLEAPGLILIGAALARRVVPAWFEALPLFGRRVLVTRPAGQAEPLLRDLEKLGAVALHLPALDVGPPADWSPVDAAIHTLAAGGFDLVTLTSTNGVHGLCGRVRALGRDARAFGAARIAAVGPRTAAALSEYGLRADVVPAGPFSADGLLAALAPEAAGKRVLVARADRGRETLLAGLGGIAAVTAVSVYRQTDAVIPADSDVFAALRRGEVGFVLVSSANVGRSLVGAFDETMRGRVERGELRLVAISADVAGVLAGLGCPAAAVAPEATAGGLVAALVGLASAI